MSVRLLWQRIDKTNTLINMASGAIYYLRTGLYVQDLMRMVTESERSFSRESKSEYERLLVGLDP